MPTVWRERGFRFFFWSDERNEPSHVHVEPGDGYAKVWLNPIRLAQSTRFDPSEMQDLLRIVSEHREKMEQAWHDHVGT